MCRVGAVKGIDDAENTGMGEAMGIVGDAGTATAETRVVRMAAPAGGCFIAADVGGTNARLSVVRTDANGGIQVLSWRRAIPVPIIRGWARSLAEFVADHPA